MTRRIVVAFVSMMAWTIALSAQPHLDRVEPFRLKVQPSGWVKLDIYGTYPSFTSGHPDLDQYEHWFLTRDGKPWQLCTRLSDSCRMVGWTSGMMSLGLNAAQWASAPGFVDVRMNEGLSADGHIEAPFSNALRVPVLAAFGAPAQIVSVSKREFVSGAPEGDFVFRIGANNFDERSVVVVFRGDEFVHPRRIYDGTTIEVAVPAKYRGMDGEVPFQLRTDSGGYSASTYLKVLKPKQSAPKVVAGIARTLPPLATSPATGTNAHVSSDAVLANRVKEAIVAEIGADAASRVEVVCKDGVVTLSGSVPTAAAKSAAESAATNVAGVKHVANNAVLR